MINVVCLLAGDKYKPIYVQNLYNMVKRHLTVPHKFICFTDHVKLHKLVEGDIEIRPLIHNDLQGWFNKMSFFSPQAKLEGVNLYFDLDVVILKNIDCFAEFGSVGSFCILNDFGQPDQCNSSIMKFNNETATGLIWDHYYKDKNRFRKLHGDQNIIHELTMNKSYHTRFPNEWTQSYKWYSRKKPRFHKTEWTFELDPITKVAVFHGQPNPHESEMQWVKENWK